MRTGYPFFSTQLNSDLWKQMDRVFDGFMYPTPAETSLENEYLPAYEVSEGDDHFVLSVDLPGVKKEEVKIEVLDRTLTISGERKRSDKVAKFSRSFTLPTTVSAEKIEAHYEDGVLQLFVPKTPAAQVRKIEIQSGKGGLLEKLWSSKKTASESNDVTQIN